ncbi:MAG: pyridoxamine 5'-phosphate oxidase family protein [Sphingomonas sp.]|nr:pyridoxamine 5'-phosphate oxidase family protein [Sphingomonas sp.]
MNDPQQITDNLFKALRSSGFIMIGLDDTPDHSQPMTAQLLDDDGARHAIWFFMGRDNKLSIGGPAMAQYVGKGHDLFACLHGTLTPENDRAMVDQLWSKQVEAWFPQGKADPNLLLMRYDLEDAEIWQSDVSLTGQFKMLFGGTIKPQEVGSHAEVSLSAPAPPKSNAAPVAAKTRYNSPPPPLFISVPTRV